MGGGGDEERGRRAAVVGMGSLWQRAMVEDHRRWEVGGRDVGGGRDDRVTAG